MGRYTKRNFSKQNRKPKHNWSNSSGQKKNMLDMGREKYFNFYLKQSLDEFKLGDNQDMIGATISNKASINSIDDAFEYINRLKEAGTIDNQKAEKLQALLKRCSKWR